MFDNNKNAKVSVDGNENLVIVNSQVEIINPQDKLQQLLQNGKIEEASQLFARMASMQHPLYPNWTYGFEMKNGNPVLTHVPTNKEAALKYPLRYNVNFNFSSLPFKTEDFNELFKKCYERQTSIEVNIISIETWIGDILVDKKEAKEDQPFMGVISPSKFPPPKPMKIFFSDNNWALDYLEMGLKEIENSRILVIDNSKQESAKILVTLKIDLNSHECKFDLKIKDEFLDNIKANYFLNTFAFYSKQGKQLIFKLLEEDQIIFISKDITTHQELPPNADKYIKLLEDLVSLEEFYNVKFKIPESGFDKEDLRMIQLLKSAKEGTEFKGSFNSISFTMNRSGIINLLAIDNERRGNLLKISKNNDSILFCGAEIFFSEHSIIFNRVQIKDKSKLKKKLKLMEEDENVKVTLEPFGESKYTEIFKREITPSVAIVGVAGTSFNMASGANGRVMS